MAQEGLIIINNGIEREFDKDAFNLMCPDRVPFEDLKLDDRAMRLCVRYINSRGAREEIVAVTDDVILKDVYQFAEVYGMTTLCNLVKDRLRNIYIDLFHFKDVIRKANIHHNNRVLRDVLLDVIALRINKCYEYNAKNSQRQCCVHNPRGFIEEIQHDCRQEVTECCRHGISRRQARDDLKCLNENMKMDLMNRMYME